MVSKYAIGRDQLHALDRALRKQQPVEGIARLRCRINMVHGVAVIDGEMRQAKNSEEISKIVKIHSRIEFAKPRLDRNLPQTRRAYEGSIFWRRYCGPDVGAKYGNLAARYSDQDMSIEK